MRSSTEPQHPLFFYLAVLNMGQRANLELSTRCSRFPKELPRISHKGAQTLPKKSQTFLFCNDSCSKRSPKKQFCCSPSLFGLMQKYNKGNFSKHFVQFYGVASVADK